jgi:hypothetical protein
MHSSLFFLKRKQLKLKEQKGGDLISSFFFVIPVKAGIWHKKIMVKKYKSQAE